MNNQNQAHGSGASVGQNEQTQASMGQSSNQMTSQHPQPNQQPKHFQVSQQMQDESSNGGGASVSCHPQTNAVGAATQPLVGSGGGSDA